MEWTIDNGKIKTDDPMAAVEQRVLRQVRAGELTPEEGALCLAGAWLKILLAAGRPEAGVNRGVLLRQARVAIDSQQPGWAGLSLDRHFRND